MRIFKNILFFYAVIFVHNSYAQIKDTEFKKFVDNTYNNTVPLISADSLKQLKNVYILDTREKEEFEISHLRNARNVGYIWFDMRSVYDIPKSATIVVYCTIGNRSEKIGEKLLKSGYKNVYNLYGSIVEWVNEGNPIYRKDGVQTTEIHTYNEEWAAWVNKGAKVY